MVKKTYTKTATILFYVSPSIETRIKNATTIDLMEGGKEIDREGEEGKAEGSSGDVPNGVKDIADIDRDGEEGNAVQTESEINPSYNGIKETVDRSLSFELCEQVDNLFKSKTKILTKQKHQTLSPNLQLLMS